MIKKEIIDGHLSCTCGDIYKSRKLVAPDCVKCEYEKEIENMMNKYAEFVAKEAWKIAKDYGFDLAGEWAIGKNCERITFENWFEQFKEKEDDKTGNQG
jgi:hypothetical protein